jgi:hypothetical protein
MVPEGALRILEEVAMGKKDKEKKQKKQQKRNEEEDEKQNNSRNGIAGTYADGHPLDEIQYLEAKLILKPDRFTSVESFRDFGKLIKKTAKNEEVGFVPDVEAGLRPNIREIIFMDTPDFRFITTLSFFVGGLLMWMVSPWVTLRSFSNFAIQTRRQQRR